MDTKQLIELAKKSLEKHGNLPIVLYKDIVTRWEVAEVHPCSNRDHLLIIVGRSTRG